MIILRQGQRGPQVEMLQLALNRAGFNAGPIDGVFGPNTLNAVLRFQSSRSLTQDGIVGPATWNALRPYLVGYTTYRIRAGDTLFRISTSRNIPLQTILIANPNVSPANLIVGSELILPFPFDIVADNVTLTYELMELYIEGIVTRYPFVRSGILSTSSSGTRNIYNLVIGTGSNQVMYNATHHANEWITSLLLMKFIEQYAKAYAHGYNIAAGTPAETPADLLYDYSTIHFVPMVNPDGADLVTGGILPNTELYNIARSISQNYPNIPFPSGWKANIYGVDPNLQYPAGWTEARRIKFAQGFTSPAPRDFVGYGPLTINESIAMANYTSANDFRLTLSYHTQGRVIFWKYRDYNPPNSEQIGRLFANLSGYALEITPYESGHAGYKDWFIQDFNRPSYTIEAGLGTSPLPLSQFPTIYNENRGILVMAALVT